MLNLLLGGGMFAGAAACLWSLMPRKGQPHHLMEAPYVQTIIPIAIMGLAVFGLGLALSGLVEIHPA